MFLYRCSSRVSTNTVVDYYILSFLKKEKLKELKEEGKDPKSAEKEAELFAKTQFTMGKQLYGTGVGCIIYRRIT